MVGEKKAAMMDPIGDRKAGYAIPAGPEGMESQVAGRKNAGLDAVLGKVLHDAPPLFSRIGDQTDGNTRHLTARRRSLHVKVCAEMLKIPVVIAPSLLRHPIQFFELTDSKKRVDIGRPQIEARLVEHER